MEHSRTAHASIMARVGESMVALAYVDPGGGWECTALYQACGRKTPQVA